MIVAARSIAAGDATNTANPGGIAKAFCVPASNTSMPNSSNLIGTPVIELTASTMNITSGYFFFSSAISASGLIVPVDVSLCTSVIASNSPVASFSSICSARIGEPQSTFKPSAAMPLRSATFSHLSEKAPFMQHRSFFETRLRMEPSMMPHADDVLRKTRRSV